MHSLNEQLFFFINNLAGQYVALDSFFVFVTQVFVPALIIFSTIYFFVVLPKNAKTLKSKINSYTDGTLFLFSISLVGVVVQLIKTNIPFPRPSQILDGVTSLSSYGNYDSFPSMHSALAFAVAVFIYQYSKKAGLIALALAILVALSRVFVGVHFPIDVLVGAFIGSIVSWGIVKVFKRDTI